MYRYIALIWNPGNSNSGASIKVTEEALTARSSDWSVVYKNCGALVAHTNPRIGIAEDYQLSDLGGVIVGTLFRRQTHDHRIREHISFNPDETRKIIREAGRPLVEDYWGRYVMIARDHATNSYHVLRDPTANMPCFHTRWRGIDIFFSDIESCIKLVPMAVSADFQYLAANLLTYYRVTEKTGLNEVDDVPGGVRVTLTGGVERRATVWNPADFCRSDLFRTSSETGAAKILRSTVEMTVNAWASCHTDIVHSLSGGLDSSIVAACLALAPSKPNVTCFNFFVGTDTQDEPFVSANLSERYRAKIRRVSTHGDERQFARLVAQRWSFPLIEVEKRAYEYDLNRIWSAPLAVRPSRYIYAIDIDDAEARVVRDTGAGAFFSGFAGDSVFYSTFQSIAAIDYAYERRFDSRLLHEVANASALSRESVWLVMSDAIRYGILRQWKPPVSDALKSPHLMKDGVVAAISPEMIEHPWTLLAGNLPPGKRNHVGGLADSALYYPMSFQRELYAPSVCPITAQPIVELCLQIPTYLLLAGRTSRGLARLAFSDLLPPEVRKRTTKGYSFSFYHHVMQAMLSFSRESLLDGILVREGILDRSKLESYLVTEQTFRTVTPGQIMSYLSAEAWARQWAAISREKAAA